jgi:putative transposase
MPKNYDLLVPEQFYHLYNRAVGSEKLFLNEENYRFFLSKINTYIPAIATIYAYCLLPNHFHFFVKIKTQQGIIDLYERKKNKPMQLNDAVVMSEFIMEQFSNCFNSYTKSFNKVYDRKGKLFMDHLRRKLIDDTSYYAKIINYIHTNPIKHKMVQQISDWKYSSYNAYINNQPTQLPRNEVLDWFGGVQQFIQFHKDLEGF